MLTATIYEKRAVEFDNPFMCDSKGNFYRLFASKFTSTLTSNRISADCKEFSRDVIVNQSLLNELEPIEQSVYIKAALKNAGYELAEELSSAFDQKVEVEINHKVVEG